MVQEQQQQQVAWSRVSGRHQPVPHATFGVIVVKEVPQVDPLHLQASLKDPGAESSLFRFTVCLQGKLITKKINI